MAENKIKNQPSPPRLRDDTSILKKGGPSAPKALRRCLLLIGKNLMFGLGGFYLYLILAFSVYPCAVRKNMIPSTWDSTGPVNRVPFFSIRLPLSSWLMRS